MGEVALYPENQLTAGKSASLLNRCARRSREIPAFCLLGLLKGEGFPCLFSFLCPSQFTRGIIEKSNLPPTTWDSKLFLPPLPTDSLFIAIRASPLFRISSRIFCRPAVPHDASGETTERTSSTKKFLGICDEAKKKQSMIQ